MDLTRLIGEAPQYRWDAAAQLFFVDLFGTNDAGERIRVCSYAMPPHIFFATRESAERALAQFDQCSRCEVIQLRKIEGG